MQQRQSADIFTFPIVKAFLVSQNSPTNQGQMSCDPCPFRSSASVEMCWGWRCITGGRLSQRCPAGVQRQILLLLDVEGWFLKLGAFWRRML